MNHQLPTFCLESKMEHAAGQYGQVHKQPFLHPFLCKLLLKSENPQPNLWKHGTNADPLFVPHYHLIQNVFCQKRGVSSLKKSKKTFLRKSGGEEEDCKGAFSHHIGQRVSKQMLQNCLLFTQTSGSPEALEQLGQSFPISGLKGL